MPYDLLSGSLLSNGPLEKRRTGGERRSRYNDWDADLIEKLVVIAYLAWFTVTLIQLVFIFVQSRKVQFRAKGPFVLLAVMMIHAATYFAILGIYFRIQEGINGDTFYYYIPQFFNLSYTAFLPGVVLYLLHVRSDIADHQQQRPMFMSRKRKKIFDWVLIALIYILLIAFFAWEVASLKAYVYAIGIEMLWTWHDSRPQRAILLHVVYALQIIAYSDVVLSSIVMYRQLKRRNTPDPVVKGVMLGTPIPFLLLTVRWLLTNISESGRIPSRISIIVASFVDGIASLAIVSLFIWAMMFPGIQWRPLGAGDSYRNTPYVNNIHQDWEMDSYRASPAPPPYNPTPGWQAQLQPAVQYSSWNGSATWKPQEPLP